MLGLDNTLYSAPIQTTPSFQAGTPRVLFKVRPDAAGFVPAPDFQRFLEVVPVSATTPSTVTLELDWAAALNPP